MVTVDSVNLTDAAVTLLAITDSPELGGSHRVAAMMVWTSLTGLPEPEAEQYARGLVSVYHGADGPAVTAHIAPF